MSDLPSMAELEKRLNFARQVAEQAGRLTLDYFQQANYDVERKADESPVTIADRKAETFVRNAIAESYPEDTVLGEEYGMIEGRSPYRWIVDPIDGTRSFICGVPLYGSLLGLQYGGRSVLGVIFLPALRECVYAAKGLGAWYVRGDQPPREAKVSSCRSLADCVFLYSQLDCFTHRHALDAFFELERAAYTTRSWGDCYGYMLIATGRADIMMDAELNLWDAAALLPVVEEAGGRFTDWQGKSTVEGGEAIATNGQLLDQVLAVTRRYPKPGESAARQS